MYLIAFAQWKQALCSNEIKGIVLARVLFLEYLIIFIATYIFV